MKAAKNPPVVTTWMDSLDHDELVDERTVLPCGFRVKRADHEVGSGGQGEINYRFDTRGASCQGPRQMTLRASQKSPRMI